MKNKKIATVIRAL